MWVFVGNMWKQQSYKFLLNNRLKIWIKFGKTKFICVQPIIAREAAMVRNIETIIDVLSSGSLNETYLMEI